LANVLSIGSFLRRHSGRRDKIDFEAKKTKILTWFNLAAAAAGTKAGIEEDEEEALQIAGVHKEPIAGCSVSREAELTTRSASSRGNANERRRKDD
jgi:hypothetical protein